VSYCARLMAGLDAGKHLCVGIDPHAHILEQWGLADSASSAERMGREVVEASADYALAVKPQVAFFERFGSPGYAALERVMQDAREAKQLIIADCKRGDIGSSFAAYAEAWLTPGSPLEADAMTVAAYQGFGSLSRALDLILESQKGLFVLAATSNAEAREIQLARRDDGRSVAASIVEEVLSFNSRKFPEETVGAAGVVLGATLDLASYGIATERVPSPHMPVLAPGFGAQGADIQDARRLFGEYSFALIANESRSLLSQGSKGLASRIMNRAMELREAIRS
jgi:orotidine-5'-phosphate decarboxylase